MVFKSWLRRIKTYHGQLFSAQKGQSIIIIVFAFLGLIAMLGLALDLGLVYIEQVRISRTTDAASLAAVVELPFEEEAMRRAIEFIELNGYSREDTEIRVRGCVVPPSGNLANVDEGADPADGLDPADTVPITPTNNVSGWVYRPAVNDPPRNVFVIDTLGYQPVEYNLSGQVTTQNNENCGPDLYGTANKLRVAGRSNVNMNFMQFFGFGEVPVEDQALGENVTSLDVVVVFDVSGSMDFETTCYGCWEKVGSRNPVDYPFPTNGNFDALTYEPDDGTYASPVPADGFNIFWDNTSGTLVGGHPVCSEPVASIVRDSEHYLIHEAEFYSRDFPLHGWEFEQRTPGQGFWVLQRIGRGSNDAYIRPHVFTTYSQSSMQYYPQLQGGSYNAECFDNSGGVGSLSGECWKTRAAALGEAAPSTVPWVEYDFTPDWTGEAHFWIRAIGGSDYSDEWYGAGAGDLNEWRKAIYWQVDNGPINGGPYNNMVGGDRRGVNENDWRWVKLQTNPVSVNAGTQYTFKLYQGSPGLSVDKIAITSNNEGSANTAIENDGDVVGGGSLDIADVFDDNSGRGPDATKGSATREACNMCNPAFGQTAGPDNCSCKLSSTDTAASAFYGAGGAGIGCTSVTTTTNQLTNDLYHDIDPLRSAKEAVKNFVARLDPKFDQVGFVPFTNDIRTPREKLQCLRYAANRYGDQKYCYQDPEPGSPYSPARPISYTRIIEAVEDHTNTSGTDISEGMREGLEELGISVPGYNEGVDSTCASYTTYSANGDKHACDRRGAARRVIILLTDGSPNHNVSCPGSFAWTGNFGQGENSYDCAMYYAKQAADNNVTVYTIGIGSGVNRDLLTAMATGVDPGTGDVYFNSRGGEYFPAARPSDLDGIFEQILSNIFVRIVG